MGAMQSRPYCLANWTTVNVQLVVQRYATKIRIDALWGVVMSWRTGDQEWTTEGNGGNSPSRQLGIIFISTALFRSSWSSFMRVALPLSRQFGITIIEHRHTGLLYGVFHHSGGRKWLILLSKPVFWMIFIDIALTWSSQVIVYSCYAEEFRGISTFEYEVISNYIDVITGTKLLIKMNLA